MASQPGKQKITIHILPNKKLQYTYCPITQEVKAIRKQKCGQLIEYNMRNIFS